MAASVTAWVAQQLLSLPERAEKRHGPEEPMFMLVARWVRDSGVPQDKRAVAERFEIGVAYASQCLRRAAEAGLLRELQQEYSMQAKRYA